MLKTTMKKYIIAFFSLMVSLSVLAQDKLNTGLNIGYVSSTFIGSGIPHEDLAPVSRALIGGYFRYLINDKFSIQPEIDFYTKGSRINTIDNLYEYVYLNYLEIPVLFALRLRNEKKLQPMIIAGPALCINTDASGSRGYLNDVKKIDAGFIAGAGIEVWKLSFQVRYDCGVVRFDRSSQKLNLRNSAFSLLVGFNFVNRKQS
jgi:hypothetical protein